MKKGISFLFIFIILISITACSYRTMNEAIPYKVNQIIHTEKLEDISIVLYDTIVEVENFSDQTMPVLGVAFLKGDNDEGWDNVGPNGWNHKDNDQITIYKEDFRDYDKEGKVLSDLSIIYGEIHNPEIKKIETLAMGEDENYKEAFIIKKDKKQYYLAIGAKSSIKALSENGEILYQEDWAE
ncbi:hypothetical protein [Bacillus tuaregi]|uniref:hypothetical protein n=1 Tax=Bacillus tuaregi TaxID=1816695 RepID=UPI0008F83DBE|nr:hypothetical protein [Bacillus tuaregi]